jgi:ribose 5-phosphate isomerase B
MKKQLIYLGADHAGFKLKEQIKQDLMAQKIAVKDLGNLKLDKNDDYPDFGYKVGQAVAKHKDAKGILICGTSFGVCIVANKVRGIRAVPIANIFDAKLSRQHNDANVLCLAGGGMQKKIKGIGLSRKEAQKIIKVWLNTPFSKEKRHRRRVNKIKKYES